MEWETQWNDPFEAYASYFNELIGDKRTGVTFVEIIKGIIGAGSVVCKQIASYSSALSKAQDGAQRVIRFATGESTSRSNVDAEELTGRLRQRGAEELGKAEEEEIWVIPDGSDLRKPYAKEMPNLMKVRDLKGKLVPGYRTLTVLGVTPGRRGILYNRVFSTKEEGFDSESAEVQKGLKAVGEVLEPLKVHKKVIWITDRGFDDVAVWRTIWEQREHLVCRVFHTERVVEHKDEEGEWVEADIERAKSGLRLMATAKTMMEARIGRQKKAKRQKVTVEVKACPIRLTYQTNVRREGEGETIQKPLWLVEICICNSRLEPWLIVTDLPVTDTQSALDVFRMYRQRWAVEDSFKFTKGCLDWEDVQLLDMEGIRTLVALAWVAAGFLYELGITLEWPEVELLARLGGWEVRKDRPPGKIVLTRGLHRLIDMMATEVFLDNYIAEHGALPPRIAALIGRPPKNEL